MKLKFSIMVLAGSMALFSCKKDKEEVKGDFSATEAKTTLNEMTSQMKTDVVELAQTEGKAGLADINDLLGQDDVFGGRIGSTTTSSKVKAKLVAFKSVFIPKAVNSRRGDDDSFDFEGNAGVYNWNASLEEFELSNETTDIIVINFPEEGSATNNASLKITEYTEGAYESGDVDIVDGNNVPVMEYLPTAISAELSIDGTKEIGVDFSASYATSGEPTAVDISVFANPFTSSMVLGSSATQYDVTTSYKNGNALIIGASGKVNFLTEEKEDPKDIDGSVTFRDYKLAGTVNAEEMDKLEGSDDPNPYIDATLSKNNRKIGDIILIYDGVEIWEEYVKFEDGSQQKLEDVLQPVIDELEKLTMDFED